MAKASRSGRRRRSRGQWERLIAEQGASGLSQRAFCERRGVSYPTFTGWKRRLRRETALEAEALPAFVEVPVAAAALTLWDVELSLGETILVRLRRR